MMTKQQWNSVLCLACKHFNEQKYGACEAFPEGIPHVIISNEIDHFIMLEGQSNDLVYEPIKKKKK